MSKEPPRCLTGLGQLHTRIASSGIVSTGSPELSPPSSFPGSELLTGPPSPPLSPRRTCFHLPIYLWVGCGSSSTSTLPFLQLPPLSVAPFLLSGIPALSPPPSTKASCQKSPSDSQHRGFITCFLQVAAFLQETKPKVGGITLFCYNHSCQPPANFWGKSSLEWAERGTSLEALKSYHKVMDPCVQKSPTFKLSKLSW